MARTINDGNSLQLYTAIFALGGDPFFEGFFG